MSDIATLGITVDTTSVKSGSANLDRLSASALTAQSCADAMGESIRRTNAAMTQTILATQQATAAIDRNSKSNQDLAARSRFQMR